ncbi:MAG: hypothetical protein ACFB0G_24625 [Leptolyngbyaceae cyanobacterium]
MKQDLQLYASEDLARLTEQVERSRRKENPGEAIYLGAEKFCTADLKSSMNLKDPAALADGQIALDRESFKPREYGREC